MNYLICRNSLGTDVFPAAVIVNFASRRHLRDVLRAFGYVSQEEIFATY